MDDALQFFGFELAGEAVAAGKLIVVLRGLKLWGLAVPNLVNGSYLAKNPRTGSISPANLGEVGFQNVLARLRLT